MSKSHTVTEPQIEEKFAHLVAAWKDATEFSSSSTEIYMNPAYQQIIGMGPAVLPLIFRDLEQGNGHWSWALRAITGENPCGPETAGDMRLQRAAWLNYARD